MDLISEIQARQLPSPRARRAIRLAAGVSQVQMARELGVHRLTLIRWENGHDPNWMNAKEYVQLLSELRGIGLRAASDPSRW